MAETQLNTNGNACETSLRTQSLRALAQSNLTNIEVEDSIDALQRAAGERDLQKYAKVKRKDRPSPPLSQPLETNRAKLRSAQDVLDRLRHDPTLNLAEYRVGYLERFEGIKEMPVKSWITETTDEEWIPQHRIRYVKQVHAGGEEEVVWNRETRVDKIFGSGGMATGDGDENVFGRVAVSRT